MTLSVDRVESGEYLIDRLEELNPWWSDPGCFGTYETFRSDLYAIRNRLGSWSDTRVLGVAGPRGVGKTTLMKQAVGVAVGAFENGPSVDVEYDRRDVLYVPFDDDPLFQLRPEAQLRAAVNHFEEYIRPPGTDEPSLFVLDDVHTVFDRSRSADDEDDFAAVLRDLYEEDENRTFLLTATADSQLRERLDPVDGATVLPVGDETDVAVSATVPEKFNDFVQRRHPEFERASDTRFRASRTRGALERALHEDDPESFVETLRAHVERHDEAERTKARRSVSQYLTVGGTVALDLAGRDDVDVQSETFGDQIRNADAPPLSTAQEAARRRVREGLHKQVPGVETIRDIGDLERLVALVARERPQDRVFFDTLTDILRVDRRTLRRKYFSALNRLYYLSTAEEYGNRRPQGVRLHIRDVGLINAYRNNDLGDVLSDTALREELTRSLVFDHLVRLSYNLNDPKDPKRGLVRFWRGDDATVDYVFEYAGIPVPVALSYRGTLDQLIAGGGVEDATIGAMTAFLDGTAHAKQTDAIDVAQYQSVSATEIEERRRYVRNEYGSEAYVSRPEVATDDCRYRGTYDEEDDAVTDAPPRFGIVLTRGHKGDIDDIGTFEAPNGTTLVQVPLWTFLLLA